MAYKYKTRFYKQSNKIKSDDVTLIANLRRRLKYNVKKNLIRYREELNSLNLLIKIAIKFDNKLYILAIKID